MSLVKAMVGDYKFSLSQIKKVDKLFQQRDPENNQNPLVGLFHGYLSMCFYMTELADHLKDKGYNPFMYNYRFWQDMEKTIGKETERIERIVDKSGEKASLVGHSQGGLIATGIAQRKPDYVDKVITLATPHEGTTLAYRQFFIKSCRQMFPGSSFLKKMHEEGLPQKVEFYAISSLHDHIITPSESSKLNYDGKNIHNLTGPENIGHIRLITLHDMILDCLNHPINTNASEQ
jgi:pimeloyl-ACP methyl ester carboxylesterase